MFYMSLLRLDLFLHTFEETIFLPFALFSVFKKDNNASLTITFSMIGALRKCSSCYLLNMKNGSRMYSA